MTTSAAPLALKVQTNVVADPGPRSIGPPGFGPATAASPVLPWLTPSMGINAWADRPPEFVTVKCTSNDSPTVTGEALTPTLPTNRAGVVSRTSPEVAERSGNPDTRSVPEAV